MTSTRESAQLLKCNVLFQGYHRVTEYHFKTSSQRDGHAIHFDREVFECGRHACVLPYDPGRNEVVLIRQFRAGAYAAGMSPWTWEMIGGVVGDGESTDAVVRREAIEEGGLALRALMPIYRAMSCPGALTETRTMYLGRVDTSGAGGYFGLVAEGEDIFAEAMTFSKALEMLKGGEIIDLTCITALQWLLLHRDEVQANWS